jgi:hypothetical protein
MSIEVILGGLAVLILTMLFLVIISMRILGRKETAPCMHCSIKYDNKGELND